MAEAKMCSPTCDFFRCGKKAAVHGGDNLWCRWTEDRCTISDCTYAMCVKRRLLPGGVCGETVRRRTTEKDPDDVIGPTVKLRGKTLRKIGEKEIF